MNTTRDEYKYSPLRSMIEMPGLIIGIICMALSPSMLFSFLPDEWQEKRIERIWDKKKWHEIRAAYFDSCYWIELAYGEFIPCETLDEIAADCIIRLRDRIWPQIEKRGKKGNLS